MYEFDLAGSFKRDYKRCLNKHWNIELLDEAMKDVVNSDEAELDPLYKTHSLKGNLKDYIELHVDKKPSGNWVMIYSKRGNKVVFVRTGTHDEILR